jgi:sirohydrochlorin ferrochelatase
MEAIVIVGYGDGMLGSAKNMDLLAEGLGERYGHPIVLACCAVSHDTQLSEAFWKCVRGGARRIVVIPYAFSLDAQEISDLAHIIQEETRKLKDVNVVIGRSLGFDESLIHIVEKRISESEEFPDVRELTLVKRGEYSDALWH